MPYDGAGNFTRAYNFTADKLAGIKIQSTRMDGEFDNVTTALNEVLLRNGVTPLTGNLKLGGNFITGVGMGAEDTPSVTFAGDATTGIFQPTAATVGFSTTGVERLRVTDTGATVKGDLGVTDSMIVAESLGVGGFASVGGILEDVVVAATALTGTVQIDATTAEVIVLTSNAVANWTFNIRGNAGATLDSVMLANQSLSFAIEVPQGVAAYYCTAITVDGGAPAQTKWFGGGAPGFGNASGIDVYTITVIKTGAATFIVRASQQQVV